jgi:REP element-mobilizing transposase RayT
MPQSLSRILVHVIFSTKDREPVLIPEIRAELHAYLASVLDEKGCVSLQVGGIEDHVQLLFALSRTLSMAQVVEAVKVYSSKWLKTQGDALASFYWPSGYGAFSVSQSNTETVVRYIQEQEEHHRHRTFQEEYRALLKRHQIACDERSSVIA